MGTLEIAGIIMTHTIIFSSDYNELYIQNKCLQVA